MSSNSGLYVDRGTSSKGTKGFMLSYIAFRRMAVRRKTVGIFQLVLISVLFGSLATSASAADKGFVIAMGGGNGTPQIYEKWRTLGGGANARVVLIPTANRSCPRMLADRF